MTDLDEPHPFCPVCQDEGCHYCDGSQDWAEVASEAE